MTTHRNRYYLQSFHNPNRLVLQLSHLQTAPHEKTRSLHLSLPSFKVATSQKAFCFLFGSFYMKSEELDVELKAERGDKGLKNRRERSSLRLKDSFTANSNAVIGSGKSLQITHKTNKRRKCIFPVKKKPVLFSSEVRRNLMFGV